MKRIAVAYWITTALVAVDFIASGGASLAHEPTTMAAMSHFGYPAYFVTLLGVWKVLGGIVLLAPGFPRLKEWAYAGIVFDVTAAAVSIVAVGDGALGALVPLLFLALTLASWRLRPESRKLGPTTASTPSEDDVAHPTEPTAAG